MRYYFRTEEGQTFTFFFAWRGYGAASCLFVCLFVFFFFFLKTWLYLCSHPRVCSTIFLINCWSSVVASVVLPQLCNPLSIIDV